jgi:aryl-alcohol dehydrogenase-like predicted oxidoreductase
MRFAAHAPGVASAIVGTSSASHLDAAIAAAERGPLDEGTLARLDAAWSGRDWPGVV